MNAREAAYLALLKSLQHYCFIQDVLDKWNRQEQPLPSDLHLAKEIAYGSSRMSLALDYIAIQLTTSQKLNLKTSEKALLRTAIYQYVFMDKIPIYAIVNETIKIAKKYCHNSFVNFLNALLRQIAEKTPSLPTKDDINSLSIRYSYPEFFIKRLIEGYGLEIGKTILDAGNKPGKTMVRIRPQEKKNIHLIHGLRVLSESPCLVALVENPSLILSLTSYPNYYIQNITPATLIGNLCKEISPPKRVLDLCASPGGKLIAVHDFFPQAELFANDTSPEKALLIESNCLKYGISVTISYSDGRTFTSPSPFDLVILDAPCSNSGVLNKRPEARWRISSENLDSLCQMQSELAANAQSLLRPGGELWYMTCSILKEENEWLVRKICAHLPLKMISMHTILPNAEGHDGGFACRLQKN